MKYLVLRTMLRKHWGRGVSYRGKRSVGAFSVQPPFRPTFDSFSALLQCSNSKLALFVVAPGLLLTISRVRSPDKPVLVFVASRRQTRLTALDLISLCARADNPRRFVRMPEEEATNASESVR